ncbi:MAG: cobalamin biosynthesis protein CbiX [Candidatus Accumulibacter sp. 66-26]|nr:CbiX/SirB N-terminal domain-containing protein [Accumulibacter sp.]OJW46747.1 MAG: cobalamin biosynthesis protein CbiX [Candidatus Accumulibacter sp. 66-26]
MPKTRTALILFAHGARDPEWASPMRRVCATVRAQAPALRVELAFLEFMSPQLAPCAEALLAEGYDRLVVLPMFIAQGGHLKRDVPLLLDELRARYPQASFELASAVGEAEPIVQAMAAHVVALAGAAPEA